MARKGYPAEFRRGALDLVAAGKPVADVARLLEVSDQSIYSWRRQELIDRGELPGLSSPEREELRVARRRIRELETELAVHRHSAELLRTHLVGVRLRRVHHRRLLPDDRRLAGLKVAALRPCPRRVGAGDLGSLPGRPEAQRTDSSLGSRRPNRTQPVVATLCC